MTIPPRESPFKINQVYYQCGIKPIPGGGYAPIISSWVYLGFVHRPGCSSLSCDVPEHFYEFQDFPHINPNAPLDTSPAPKLGLCTWKGESMMTWETLLEH